MKRRNSVQGPHPFHSLEAPSLSLRPARYPYQSGGVVCEVSIRRTRSQPAKVRRRDIHSSPSVFV